MIPGVSAVAATSPVRSGLGLSGKTQYILECKGKKNFLLYAIRDDDALEQIRVRMNLPYNFTLEAFQGKKGIRVSKRTPLGIQQVYPRLYRVNADA